MRDKFNRTIDYMRISITDRCNLRCIYCMPSDGLRLIEHKEILSYEEILRIIRIAAGLGVRKIRITGGEPLARKNITSLTSSIKNIPGIEDLSITTNGILLEKYAEKLMESGVDRVNVSLDSLRPERFKEITRGGDINVVLRGIETARKSGLLPVKINMIPIKGLNGDEIIDFARITLNSDYHVRFIEFMPFGSRGFWSADKHIPRDEIKSIVETLGPLIPVRVRKNGPSKYFRLKDAQGVIGFISAITHHFCEECNRLRLTSNGKLKPCLFSETEIDLKPALRGGASDEEIERLLRLAIEIKPGRHNISDNSDLHVFQAMSQIGG
ncbi:MAG: cyclic pyranopterin phosphate synthase MoaA [Nitrospirae bacterium RBG_16_43_8]|nr:MAG: cyclic pyranopterin phosphate synthase MoaA [Nitrospirae bacterium RBG_16_43_8]